jgi:hypothetical protein
VRKTDYIARLFHLSGTGDGFGVVIAMLILIATSAAAQPFLTLAPARDPQMTEKTFTATYGDLLSGVDESSFNLKDGQLEAVGLQYEKTTESLSEVRLEKQPKSGQRDPFQFVHQSLNASSQSNMSFSLQAGYGRIWDEQSMLQKIASDRQDPGCAYVSANFSF